MCYAVHRRITEVKDKIAVVDYFGEKRNVLDEFGNVQGEDYVYAHIRVIVDKIPEKETIEILDLWRKFF
mgnify:CR=1 FL=1